MKYYRFKNGFFLCSQKGCFHLAKVRVDVVDNETETKKRLLLLAVGNVELEGEYKDWCKSI